MRQVLFYIPLKEKWSLGPLGDVPGFGFGIVLLVWCLIGGFLLYQTWRTEKGLTAEMKGSLVSFFAFALGIILLPSLVSAPRIPVYGYGAMLVAACLASGWVARKRSPLAGVDPDFSANLAVVMVLVGIVGARLLHLIRYHDRAFARCQSLQDYLLAAVNLPDGGLVLHGGIALAAVVYVLHCRKHHISPLKYGDAVIPALFVGIAFGRVGCFLNGCCFGGVTTLPWGVSFPQGSVPWKEYVERGLLDPGSACTAPLHPTQLYSVIDGLLLALITTVYYRYRRGDGSVIALGAIAYSMTRFFIESLRTDEQGQPGFLNIGLTPAQEISLATLVFGLMLAWWSHTSGRASSVTSEGRQPA